MPISRDVVASSSLAAATELTLAVASRSRFRDPRRLLARPAGRRLHAFSQIRDAARLLHHGHYRRLDFQLERIGQAAEPCREFLLMPALFDLFLGLQALHFLGVAPKDLDGARHGANFVVALRTRHRAEFRRQPSHRLLDSPQRSGNAADQGKARQQRQHQDDGSHHDARAPGGVADLGLFGTRTLHPGTCGLEQVCEPVGHRAQHSVERMDLLTKLHLILDERRQVRPIIAGQSGQCFLIAGSRPEPIMPNSNSR